jgi:hypothetical protein
MCRCPYLCGSRIALKLATEDAVTFSIVTYFFCNDRAIGAKRWRDMASLLCDHGQVTAFCGDGSSVSDTRIRVVHVPDRIKSVPDRNGFVDRPHNNKVIRTAFHLAQSLLFWPDRQKWWARKAVAQAGVSTLDAGDVLITSGPRFSVHAETRCWLERQARPPFWVMDLRDPWTNDPSPAIRRRTPAFLTRFEARIEAACHRRAGLVTTVSETMTALMKRDFQSRAVTIYNGYPEELAAAPVERQPKNGLLRICYLGSIVHGLRSPRLLFAAAQQLNCSAARLRFQFWCNDSDLVMSEAAAQGVTQLVECHPPVSFKESIQIQRQADANLVLNGIDPTANHMITGKVFELIAARRPLLAVTGPASELRHVSEQCGCNGVAWDSITARTALHRLLDGSLMPVHDSANSFSRRAAVERFLDAIASARRTPLLNAV